MDGAAQIPAPPKVLTGEAVAGRASWRVPVELALAVASPQSVARQLVYRRRAAGDRAKPTATIYRHADALYAIVDFYGEGRAGLLFRLDVALWENL